MRERDRLRLQKALAVLRDPSGDGKTRVSHGFSGEPMKCVKCHRPTGEIAGGGELPASAGPFCACPGEVSP